MSLVYIQSSSKQQAMSEQQYEVSINTFAAPRLQLAIPTLTPRPPSFLAIPFIECQGGPWDHGIWP